MSKVLQTFALVDLISGPLSKMVTSIDKTTAKLGTAALDIEAKFDKAQMGIAKSASSLGGSLSSVTAQVPGLGNAFSMLTSPAGAATVAIAALGAILVKTISIGNKFADAWCWNL